ncbi:hypothetical protein HDE_06406 [Halotydeus destructor]|nr:hypothetical protein HDE_06406 [Halotydeus destructor]
MNSTREVVSQEKSKVTCSEKALTDRFDEFKRRVNIGLDLTTLPVEIDTRKLFIPNVPEDIQNELKEHMVKNGFKLSLFEYKRFQRVVDDGEEVDLMGYVRMKFGTPKETETAMKFLNCKPPFFFDVHYGQTRKFETDAVPRTRELERKTIELNQARKSDQVNKQSLVSPVSNFTVRLPTRFHGICGPKLSARNNSEVRQDLMVQANPTNEAEQSFRNSILHEALSKCPAGKVFKVLATETSDCSSCRTRTLDFGSRTKEIVIDHLHYVLDKKQFVRPNKVNK